MATNVPAVFGVNKFLWAKIKEAVILDEANYGGLIPIVPGQEVPALRQAIDEQAGVGGHPYIVYSWYTNGYNQDWFNATDTVVYVINSTNGKKLRELLLLMVDVFKKHDESAEEVNRYVHRTENGNRPDHPTSPGTFVLSDDYRQYVYQSISVAAAQASRNTALEDEPVEALVTVRVSYTNDRDSR